jgi:hypothetical protein
MSWRQCEVILVLPDGRRYSAVIPGGSVYQAALAFQDHCNNGPPELKRPHVSADSKLEGEAAIYRIEMKKVLEFANWTESREGKRARRQH